MFHQHMQPWMTREGHSDPMLAKTGNNAVVEAEEGEGIRNATDLSVNHSPKA